LENPAHRELRRGVVERFLRSPARTLTGRRKNVNHGPLDRFLEAFLFFFLSFSFACSHPPFSAKTNCEQKGPKNQ
jgi:hypothetical protein